MKGWTGESCGQCIAAEGCLHGTCSLARECNCNEGWTGESCNHCIKEPSCLHGYCNLPFECNCEAGWTGKNCDESMIITMSQFLTLDSIANGHKLLRKIVILSFLHRGL